MTETLTVTANGQEQEEGKVFVPEVQSNPGSPLQGGTEKCCALCAQPHVRLPWKSLLYLTIDSANTLIPRRHKSQMVPDS